MMEEEFRKLTKWRMAWEAIQFFGVVGLVLAGAYFLLKHAVTR